MKDSDILVETKDFVTTVRFNRPEVLNSFASEHFRRIEQIFTDLKQDDATRVVIITGEGRAFCAGADLSQIDMADSKSRRPKMGTVSDWVTPILELTKPVIAAVNGPAVGAGLAFALAADIRVASDKARFSAIFRRIGMLAVDGVTWLLPRVVGTSKALEMIYSGDMLDAQEAERIGLVSYVVPHDDLLDRVNEMARQYAEGPPIALQLSKSLVMTGLSKSYADHLSAEQWASLSNRVYAGHDVKEGSRAFKEKRPASFRGYVE